MKEYQRIRLRKGCVPDAVYEAVCNLWPNGRKIDRWGDEFNFECWVEDTELGDLAKRILSVCQQAGLPQSRQGGPGTYGHDVDRVYDNSDYNSSEYLLLRRQREIQLEHERDAQGRLLLVASKAKPSIKLGRIYPNWIIVSDKVRRLLEPQRFKGLEFGEVVLKGKSIHASKEAIWEVRSSIVLPKMANTHLFFHPGREAPEQFTGDYAKIIGISDPPYNNSEPHYRRGDLTALGSFDIARTFENYNEPHPALVVSQRLYQFCLKNKIPLNVQPVRVDPD